VQYLNRNPADANGMVTIWFKLNGQDRTVEVKDFSVKVDTVQHRKAGKEVGEVGAPLQGSLSKILVKKGDMVQLNDPLFIIEAMKMESTITAPIAGRIGEIYLTEKTMVQQGDLVLEVVS
jgi:pyruvate carboxylase